MNCNPDLQWYLNQSTKQRTSPRCPFSTVSSCPRFYQSSSLLGRAGSTEISEKENKELLKKWKKSPLWPTTAEQSTSIAGPSGNYKHFWNFCPEVSYERFGLFASHLDEYGDEIDIGIAHRQLSNSKASADDWRWNWSNVTQQHYSECPLYSVLSSTQQTTQNKHDDIVTLKPSIYGIGIDIKALWRKIKNWF